MAAPSPRPRHRVVIVGGGFGGLYAAKELGRAPVDVTLVDRRNFHLFQPLLYQVATGALSPGEIAQPLPIDPPAPAEHDRPARRGGRHRPDTPRVILADGGPIAYDTLIVATGAQLLLLRPRRVGAARARAQVHRRRDRDPPPDPDRLRGGRARGRPRAAGGLDDVRRRRRRPDRRRAGRCDRRDRPRHAPARLPAIDPPERPHPPRRGARPDPADLSARSVALGPAPARAPRGDGANDDEGRRRSPRTVSTSSSAGRSSTIPTRTVLWAAGVLASRFAGRWRRRRAPRPTGPVG